MLPAISMGCWHNFGQPGSDAKQSATEAMIHDNCRDMLRTSFDLGITHFDLANNYGPPPGSAEQRVGQILKQDFQSHRDELIISTKAGYRMWPGPYGDWGSRKYLLASLDQSLSRLGLDYVDIFYSHRPDPDTPLVETLFALDTAVTQGKALYVGISSYSGEMTARALDLCEQHGWVKPIIHQPMYNMLYPWIEDDLLPVTRHSKMGVIAFCPLAQGLLTDKYLQRVPEDSRANYDGGLLGAGEKRDQKLDRVRRLNDIAQQRGQSLAQMALSWVLRDHSVTSALIGASRASQITENVKATQSLSFDDDHLDAIDAVIAEAGSE